MPSRPLLDDITDAALEVRLLPEAKKAGPSPSGRAYGIVAFLEMISTRDA
jgi:hypothetical protein